MDTHTYKNGNYIQFNEQMGLNKDVLPTPCFYIKSMFIA